MDGRLNFDCDKDKICHNASKNLHAWSRVCKLIYQYKRRMRMKIFINALFPYCSLVQMFRRRNTEKRVRKMHEKALKLVYDDNHYL